MKSVGHSTREIKDSLFARILAGKVEHYDSFSFSKNELLVNIHWAKRVLCGRPYKKRHNDNGTVTSGTDISI